MKMNKPYFKKVLVFLFLLVFMAAFLEAQVFAEDSDVQSFVTRFYQQCLGRNPDAGGLGHWVSSLDAGDKTGEDLAQTFVFSEEFEGLNTSNAEFVTVLYRAFFNREPDTGGYEIWMNSLSRGVSRSAVLDGFTSAQEFANLCETYGITPVSPDAPVVDPPTPDCINLNGARFTVTEIRNLSSCGVANDVDSFTATVNQTGCSVSILDSDGIWATGTLSGNQLTITSVWYENGGRVNAMYHISISNDGYSFQGTGSGTWTDGYDTCYPTSSISGIQY